MAGGANALGVDWSLLKSPDYVGDYANAFATGRRLAQARDEPPANLLGQAQPQGAAQPATAGDLIAARLAAMNDEQRAAAARRADKIAGVLRGIQAQSPDPAERLRIAQHVAPAAGLDPAKISIGDVTDQGIAGHLAQVAALNSQLQPSGAGAV